MASKTKPERSAEVQEALQTADKIIRCYEKTVGEGFSPDSTVVIDLVIQDAYTVAVALRAAISPVNTAQPAPLRFKFKTTKSSLAKDPEGQQTVYLDDHPALFINLNHRRWAEVQTFLSSALTPPVNTGPSAAQWQPMSEARKLPENTPILVYRPLAHLTNDEQMRVVRTTKSNHTCWDKTVPPDEKALNFTDGACWCQCWQPAPVLPPAPTESTPCE